MSGFRFSSRAADTLLYLSVPVLNLATAPILARSLGPIGRGQYGVALSLSALSLAIGGLGQSDIYISRARENLTSYKSNVKLSFLGNVIASTLTVIYGQIIGLPLAVLIAACAWNPILTLANLWRSTSISSGQHSRAAYAVFLAQLARLVFLVCLAQIQLLTPETAALATQGSIVLGAVSFLFVTRKKWNLTDTSSLKAELQRGLPIVGFNLLLALVMKSDVVILQMRSNATEVGLYTAAVSLTAAGLAISASFKNRIQATLARNDLQKFRFEMKIALISSGLVSVGIFMLSNMLVKTILGEAFLKAIPIMQVMGFATGALMMLDVIVGSLIAVGATTRLYLVSAFGAVVTLSGLLIFSGPFGAVGACFATMSGYAVAALFGFFQLTRALGQGAN